MSDRASRRFPPSEPCPGAAFARRDAARVFGAVCVAVDEPAPEGKKARDGDHVALAYKLQAVVVVVFPNLVLTFRRSSISCA